MIIHLNNCPPLPFLKQVALHWPEATWLYIYLWEHKDEKNMLSLNPEQIEYNFEPTCFKNNLRNLNLEGLIDYYPKVSGEILIELVDWSDIEEK